MSLDFDVSTFPAELAHEVAVTEVYLTDLRRMQDGKYPSAEELAAATVIRGARRGLRPTGCVVGVWAGFDREMRSSRLLVLAARDGWARTAGRLYRLEGWQGRPGEPRWSDTDAE